MATPLSKNDQRLADAVSAFGCPGIVSLRNEQKQSPAHISYLDLLSDQVQDEAGRLPDAVAEFQGKPVMYLIDAESGEPDLPSRINLQQRLANRGDHAVLAIVRPGELVLYPLNLDRKTLNKNGLGTTIRVADPRAPFLFHEIATGSLADLEGQPKASDPVFEEIKSLLDKAVNELVVTKGLNGLAVLSMTGRALFFRFLFDRRIVTDELITEICPAAKSDAKEHRLLRVFSTPERAAQTSTWLDVTFNGDLLPLIDHLPLDASAVKRTKAYLEVYQKAGEDSAGSLFQHLEAILRGWEHVAGIRQPFLPGIDWHQLNFRHIPIGVLSQVYENFSHRVDETDSTARSVHYTPRTLAKLLVDEALAGLDTPSHQAKILDPACGAGVFLVLALRELVRRRWAADKERLGGHVRRPSKQVIESILHNQIRGFDVSESALRLAAMGLYITVIELNEITTPPSAHHATKALQGLVLFDQRTEAERAQTGFVLGSLGDAVDEKKFNGFFDVVVGNPPWSVVGDKERSEKLDRVGTDVARRILISRGLDDVAAAYDNPGGVPDMPFLWRAAEWARHKGILAFAVDARFILKQTATGIAARNAWFQAVQVTGILNGSDLEKTSVWACHDQPWILLWSRNEKPDLEKQAFHLACPVREDELAKRGEFRLDYRSAYQVTVKAVIEQPWLCKALTIGSTLDVNVMEKICRIARKQSIGGFWRSDEQVSCIGLDIKPFKPLDCPEWLIDLEVFDGEDPDLIIDGRYPTYRQRHGDREPKYTKSENNYRSPVTCIRRAPGEARDSTKSYRLPRRKMAFSKNFFGYTAYWHNESELLCALLHVIAHSQLFQHFSYMRSGQMGARKRILDKLDIDAFPFPDIEHLTNEQRAEIMRLADMLDGSGRNDWETLDAFVGGLFGLTKAEQQVVADTVTFNGPYAVVREQSMRTVPKEESAAFVRTLEQAIQPFFKAVGQKVKAALVPRLEGDWQQPWAFVTLLLDGDSWTPSNKLIASLVGESSASAASRLIMPLPEGGLIIGLLNKRRFWTRSRARLCALHIAEEHLERCFPLPART
ncbi:MAG: SAM-dependent methyltransferase [Prosthecobacter sp.]|uniref:N-6 DNA methylase n=1 Tax=Prosthecobacter sp. TaxID=1965333 RepID=UPI0026283F93|nr:N-6 DNA methylase [Prosthecobacter sp.]MCF7790096.1 SAM-dependent methyltransferase [Prosthecobacter sp.]